MFLHKFIAIQSTLYLLYAAAGFTAILDRVFAGIADTTSTPIGWEGGGGRVAMKWRAKPMSLLKTGK